MKDSLYLYNTLTRKKELFKPIDNNLVTIYSCGPTVYSSPHFGNMRAYAFVDNLVRTLKLAGYNVKNIINITDVGHLTDDSDNGDDKMELAARKSKKSAYEIAKEYTEEFYSNLKDLNIDNPYLFPLATDHIKEQIEMIEKLEKKGFTYLTDDGVYFDTSKFSSYKELAKLDISGLSAGYRVDLVNKQNITDFALWKFPKAGEKREMEWNSPWGKGFPGWHLECSAMAMKHLGETIDIHTGGIDHIAVHHTNEIAQSEAASGKKFVNYWLHVNFLLIENDDNKMMKMSKSIGVTHTINAMKNLGFDPIALKYLYLNGHYRNELKFNYKLLEKASDNLLKLKEEVYKIREDSISKDYVIDKNILNFMLDDLNTVKALAYFYGVLRGDNTNTEKLNAAYTMDMLFGLELLNYKKVEEVKDEIPINIIYLAEQRLNSRNEKDWSMSDLLRKDIEAKGYLIEDTKDSYKIKKVKNNKNE